ncbi:MAG: peroxiredoxin family protein [Chthonomonadales bacterium]
MADFTLKDTAGRLYRSASARAEGPVVFAFYKRSCPTCLYTLPFLQRLHEAYAGGSARVWGISQDTPEDTDALARELGITFPLLIDADLEVTEAYDLVSVPNIYLADEGSVIVRHAPAFIASELNAMARIFAERTGMAYRPVVREEDHAPSLKPG